MPNPDSDRLLMTNSNSDFFVRTRQIVPGTARILARTLVLGTTFCLSLACSGESSKSADTSGTSQETQESQSENQGSTPSQSGDGSTPSSDIDTPQSSESDDGSDDSAGSDQSEDPGVKFDVDSSMIDFEPEQERGCEKIDFLFVVDNSRSMEDEQRNLVTSFPGFMTSIKETLMAREFHIMAVDTDAGSVGGSSSCINKACTCDNAPACCQALCGNGTAETCNNRPCSDFDGVICDIELGAGRTQSGDGQDCQIADDRRYLLADQPDLEDSFSCVATVGIGGSGNELPMQSMMDALADKAVQGDGCNEGFLREDAILVVTFITDEEDKVGKSMGNPADWRQALIDAKGGNEDAVVVIGLFGDRDAPMPICDELNENSNVGAEASPRLREFVESFGDHGMAASVCADDYEPYFTEAVSIIEGACDQFVPK